MKITVVGPGAIGCLFAAYLARAGEQVALLDYRSERAALLSQKGIVVDREKDRFRARLKVTADPGEVRETAVLIFCVKAGDTGTAGARLRGIISDESYFLTLQNGLGNLEKLGELFGKERGFAGVTSHGATLIDTGHVRHAGIGDIWLGLTSETAQSSKAEAKLQDLAATFNRAGLQANISGSIEGLIWRKLLVNVGINALTAILGVPNGKLLVSPACRELMSKAVAEAVQVAELCNIPLNLAEELERVRHVCRATAANISSMLQDVRRKKNTEIAYINGAVVQIAASNGVAAPVNEVLTALVKSLEAHYEG